LPIRLPDEILYKLLKIALTENACRNRGYILDGYPRTFKNACEVFLKKIKKFDEEGNEIEEDEPELEEGEEKSWEGYEPNKDIFPSSVIVLKGEDSFLIDRVKNLEEKEI
jgi:adenylate kinase